MCSTTRPLPSLRLEWSQYQRMPQVKGHASRTQARRIPPNVIGRAGRLASWGPGACALTNTSGVSAPRYGRLRNLPVVEDPGEVAGGKDRGARRAVDRG